MGISSFRLYLLFSNVISNTISGASSIARGLSMYIDELIGNRMAHFFQHLLPMRVSFLASYLDFFAFTLIILVAILLSAGVKKSITINNIFTTIALATIGIVIVAGAIEGKL